MMRNMVQFCSKDHSKEANKLDNEYTKCINKIREELYQKVIPLTGFFPPMNAGYDFKDGSRLTLTIKPIEDDLKAKILVSAFCDSKTGLFDIKTQRFDSTEALKKHLDSIDDEKIKKLTAASED